MGYAQRKETTRSTLDFILLDMAKVSEAPTASEVEDWPIEAQRAEREALYKCIDSDGNVFVTRHPHLPQWRKDIHAGKEIRIAVLSRPVLKYTSAQVRELLAESRSERAKERSRKRRKKRSKEPHLFDVSKNRNIWEEDNGF